ncbi:MAG: hypothetical protein WBX15_00770 [Thermoanaerobaculia bacterium]
MPDRAKLALRLLAGFVAGLAIWVALSPTWDRIVAASAEPVLRLIESPSVTRLHQAEDDRITIERSDFPPRSARPAIAVRDLTFNFILLLMLFAIGPRPLSSRNVGGFLLSSAILFVTHVAATVIEVEALYATQLGPWSAVHYGASGQLVWGAARQFYRLVGMFAIAFALWWALRDPGPEARTEAPVRSRPKKRRNRRAVPRRS